MPDEPKKHVVALDVGFRTAGWVRLYHDGRLEWGVIATEPPPSKRERMAGQLALHDDQTILSLFRAMRDVLSRPGCAGLVYEVPGKGQGARAVEAMAFARAAFVAAAGVSVLPIAQVSPLEVDACINPPPPPRLPSLKAPKRGASDSELDAYKAAKKAQAKEKERRRKERKLSTAGGVASLGDLRTIQEKTADWSHVCDAAAVLVAEATKGDFIQQKLSAEQQQRLIAIGERGRRR